MKIHFDELFDTFSDNIVLVSYVAEFGGSAVRRIIISHDSFYSEIDNSLKFPDNVEGFDRHLNHFLDFKEQHLACAHTDDLPVDMLSESFLSKINNDDIIGPDLAARGYEFYNTQRELLEKGNNVCWRLHHDEPEKTLFKKVKIIKLYGNGLSRFNKAMRYKKVGNRYHGNDYIPPSKLDHILNIEAEKLFSKNYDEFLTQYLKIVEYLDLKPKINSVRQFILLWLEKQERFKLTLS